MTLRTHTQATHQGIALPFTAASGGGDTIPIDSNGVVLLRNADATATTITVVVPGTEYGQSRPDYTYSVAAGATALLGPFPKDLAVDGLVSLTYSKVTSLTLPALRT